METHLADWLQGTLEGEEAEAILRRCVHCGFCTATCPTYQLLGDELDSPRGRIYLIKQVVEGVPPSAATQLHLDRCLTCRNCETTCPSGVEYGRLVDIGRKLVDARVQRPASVRLLRTALQETMTRRWVFDPAMRLGQAVRGLLPPALQAKVPQRRSLRSVPGGASRTHPRQVFLLNGCVQPAMMPSIDVATTRVLDALGIGVAYAEDSACCGAIRHHLDDQAGGLDDARRNIDAWLPALESKAVEAIVINASGCGAMVKDYAHLLRDDPVYAERAQRVCESVFDLAEFLAPQGEHIEALLAARTGSGADASPAESTPRVAFHPPCTLQHGQKLGGVVEALLDRWLPAAGAQRVSFAESNLCCGSAGTYSVLQPELSGQLRERKLAHLAQSQAALILSANIGCISHLQGGSATPVRHWVEWLDEALLTPPL